MFSNYKTRMTEQVFATADKLSEIIWNMKKCLQCTICLHTISEPMKTRCGHQFCRQCIQRVLESKNALCPMCNTNLPRRGVLRDKYMEVYIDNLQQLTEAIKKDSGIDISSYTSRIRSTRESCLLDATEHHKFDKKEFGPSCSNVNLSSSKRLSTSQSKCSAKKRKKVTKNIKGKKDNIDSNDIKRYLNKYSLSGIEPLTPDKSVSCYDDNSMDSKVKSWLQTLPKNDALDDPDKIATTKPIECNFDDTVMTSISHVGENVKCDMSEKNDAKSRLVHPANDGGKGRTLRSMKKQFSTDSSHEVCRNTPETDDSGLNKVRGKALQMDANPENRRSRRSSAVRSNQDNKEQEKKPDVHRTSPCNMLPVMKQNWSCIAKFGKELRPKKKKLRSLNVNIESKNNRRSLNEIETEETIKSEAIKGMGDKGTKSGSNTLERIANAATDSLENTLPNIQATGTEEGNLARTWTRAEETPTKNKDDGSTSTEVPAEESSFIADEKGEQSCIATLNSSQIKNIGVARSDQDRRSEIGNVPNDRDPERDVLPLKKRNLLSRTPTRDRFNDSLQVTPTKAAVEVLPNTANVTSGLANCSPDLLDANCLFLDEETSVGPCQTSSCKRLSLKKRSTDPKSNDPSKTNDVSRVLAVKRDLNLEMDQDTEDSADESSRSRLTSETKCKPDGNNKQEIKRAAGRSVGYRSSASSNENMSKQQDSEGQCKRFVTFKKLGKVYKHRKKPVTFLYLGSIRPKLLQCQKYSQFRLQEPRSPVELGQSSTQKFRNHFDDDTQIISDHILQDEVESSLSIETTYVVARTMDESTAEIGQSRSVQPGVSMDKPRTKQIDTHPSTQNSASGNRFGNDTRITVNDTRQDEVKSSLPIRTTYVVTKTMDVSEAETEQSVQPGASMDKPRATKHIDTHTSTQNFATGNHFGNDTRITVNDTRQDEVKSSLPIRATYVVTRTMDVSKAETEQSVQPGASMDKLQTTKRIDMYKGNSLKTITLSTTSLENQSRDSNDILFVSLFDNEEKDPNCSRSSISETTVANSSIKLLSPKKDSQLKFLSLDSPAMNVRDSTQTQQADAIKDSSVKKSNFSDIKGTHSRALIRRSQQAYETSELDLSSSSDRKRKRSRSGDKSDIETKRTSMDEKKNRAKNGDSDSSCSHSSKATYVRSTNKRGMKTGMTDGKIRPGSRILSSNSTKDATIVNLSSGTETDNKESGNEALERKRSFKRIVPLVSSDTDSNETSCLNNEENGANDQASPTSKRKRAPSPDSDCNAELNVIVSNWYRDLNATERCAKKGKVEQTRALSTFTSLHREKRPNDLVKSSDSSTFDFSKMADGTASKYRSVIDIASSSDPSDSVGAKKSEKTLGSVETFNSNDSPDFGSIVDKMRVIQKSAAMDVEKNEQRDMSLMQDNFDEFMANVDTEALINEYSTNKRSMRDDHVKSTAQGTSTFRSSSKDDSIFPKSKVSDKENKYKDLEELYESFNDDDKTLIPEYTNLVDKSSKRRLVENDETQTRIKPLESTSKEPSRMNNALDRTSAHNLMFPNNDKVGGDTDNDATAKETCCYEQDSLMDITQHYLQIKQFEEDLFGKPANTNAQPDKRKEMNELRTPQKTKNGNARCSNSKETDAEHSGEEDDIVENTPDVKTKSAQPIDSTVKESLNASPASRIGQFERTPFFIAGGSSSSSTPVCKKIPLYQSTPKVQVTAKNSSGSSEMCHSDKEFKHLESTNDKRTKNVSVIGAASFGRQKLCFVCSGLVQAQIEHVKRLASMVNARYVTQFDREVTHVIVKTDDGNSGASKTLKYLQGIAHRKWIVGTQWVIDSLKAKKLINEEHYEVVDCRTLKAGPRNSRLREKELFEDFVFLCIGPYADVSIEQYQELLRATGATVVGSLQALAAEKGRLKIIMIQADIYDYEIIVEWYKQTHAVPVVHDWVIECISQYKLISLYPYLQELSQQDVLALGYPEFLVEEDLDADSDIEEDPDADSICDVST